MDAPLESAADEITRLRDCLNDLQSASRRCLPSGPAASRLTL